MLDGESDFVHRENLSVEAAHYLEGIRSRYNSRDVKEFLDSLTGLRVLVVGDAIIDEYHFCKAYGMASKSSTIAAQFERAEAYAGGSLAVANHVAGFANEVTLLTCLGRRDPRDEFIKSNLHSNIEPILFFRDDAPTVVKRRFVHSFMVTKLFEISFFNDEPISNELQSEISSYLDRISSEYDVIIVADFGHGLLTGPLVESVSASESFVAINTQTNSINMGYNVITKYPRVDYVSMDEEETRMACRDRYGPLEGLIEGLAQTLRCSLVSVTRGHHGSVTYSPEEGFFKTPVLTSEVVDTTGAGDAYLALTSLCAARGLPPDLIGLLGNVAGALAVRIVGNKESVRPDQVVRLVDSVLP